MSLFAQRKPRSSRTALIGAETTLLARIGRGVRDQEMMGRLALCLLTLLVLVVAVEAWTVPFRHRVGQIVPNGILARVDFDRVNRVETERRRAERTKTAPFVFRNNARLLDEIGERFAADLDAVRKADTPDLLAGDVQDAFGFNLAADSVSQATTGDRNLYFSELKELISSGSGADDLVLKLREQLNDLLDPVEESGIAQADEMKRLEIADTRDVAIVSIDDPSIRRLVKANEIRKENLFSETGAIGSRWVQHPLIDKVRPQIEHWLRTRLPATLTFDEKATEEARLIHSGKAEIVSDHFLANDILAAPGTVIDSEMLLLLRAEYAAVQTGAPAWHKATRAAIVFLLLCVLAVLFGYYLVSNHPKLVRNTPQLSLFFTMIIVSVVLGRLLTYSSMRAEVVPVVVTVMIFAIAYDQLVAVMAALMLSLVISMSTLGSVSQFVVLLSVSTVTVLPLGRVSARSSLIRLGFLVGAVYLLASVGAGITESAYVGGPIISTVTLVHSLAGAGWCLAAGYLVAGSLPFIESAFGVVTNISLQEMSDVSHPLLQELVRRAPGTYNHSMAVASIAEAAAERIGANGRLVRVGAYFHDIGKMLKPQYFVENFSEGSESPHTNLAPAMSTLVIIGHVKDGVDLALQHNLPKAIIDFVEQHHGTTLVQYFYHEAARQASEQPDHRTDAEESSFRYPGPKPQTKEAGVMMVADAVESASRTLSEPTPKRIESLVHKITLDRLQDGQFDESALTMCEIRQIEESLTKSLTAVYHSRIKYPEARTA